MARTYESALAHLDLIQSNQAITSLFSPPPSTTTKLTPQELNAQAIPEMLSWLHRANLNQTTLSQCLRCIHVSGTKGKGSVCAYLTSILTHPTAAPIAGRVGTYTSPHLLSVRERIQIDGAPLSPTQFTTYFFEVWDAFTAAALRSAAAIITSPEGGELTVQERERQKLEAEGPASKPFYFRFLTILALHAFLRAGVRSAVVECGIGGEFDSTNVLPAEAVTASVITQLGIDHVGMLGATLPEIAWHKAGVCKEGRKCFTRRLEGGSDGEEKEEAMRVLRTRAAEKGAMLVEVEDREVQAWGGVETEGGLEGGFQRYNQALALRAASEHLRMLSGGVDEQEESITLTALGERFADDLRAARLRGRCETRVDGDITWLIDGAHTAESMQEVAKWFAGKSELFINDDGNNNTKVVLLFNQQERDVEKLLRTLLAGIEKTREKAMAATKDCVFDSAIFTRNELHPRTTDQSERDLAVQKMAADAMRAVSPQTEISITDNVGEAVEKIKGMARGGGVKVAILATGSLHLVGAVLRTLEPESLY